MPGAPASLQTFAAKNKPEKSQLLNPREMAAQGSNANKEPEQPELYDTLERLDIVGA